MYKAPPKRELAEEPAALDQVSAAPPPAPEANLKYKKKGEESNGVLAMIDLIVADIDKEIQTMTLEEKDAQKDYEGLVLQEGGWCRSGSRYVDRWWRFPYMKIKSILISWFLGFLDSKFQGFKVSKIHNVHFKYLLEDIDPILPDFHFMLSER